MPSLLTVSENFAKARCASSAFLAWKMLLANACPARSSSALPNRPSVRSVRSVSSEMAALRAANAILRVAFSRRPASSCACLSSLPSSSVVSLPIFCTPSRFSPNDLVWSIRFGYCLSSWPCISVRRFCSCAVSCDFEARRWYSSVRDLVWVTLTLRSLLLAICCSTSFFSDCAFSSASSELTVNASATA